MNGVNSNEDSYRLTDRFLFTLEYAIIYRKYLLPAKCQHPKKVGRYIKMKLTILGTGNAKVTKCYNIYRDVHLQIVAMTETRRESLSREL